MREVALSSSSRAPGCKLIFIFALTLLTLASASFCGRAEALAFLLALAAAAAVVGWNLILKFALAWRCDGWALA